MSLKERISSPLEAGTSILDAHHLPPHIVPALEYVSSKLAKKGLHFTLVVVRRDYQLPVVIPPFGAPGMPAPASPLMSSRLGLTTPSIPSPSPVTALKQLVRTGSGLSIGGGRAAAPAVSSPPSSAHSFSSASSQTSSSTTSYDNPWLWWPRTPATPLSPPPPATPSTASSVLTADSNNTFFGPVSPGILRLVHTTGLHATEERHLRNALLRAEKKFNTEGNCLSPALSPAACGLTSQLIQSSIVQNEVLFSSEGLTLLSLDRLYSLKSALSSYSKTRYPLRLEDAVDELRRVVLANNGCKVTRSDLLRSHDWLSVSHSSILDLDRMYRRAYGGPEGVGAISGVTSPPKKEERPLSSPFILQLGDEAGDEEQRSWFDDIMDEDDVLDSTIEICKPPTPRGPTLKLQTSFDPLPLVPAVVKDNNDNEGDQDSDLTPRAGAGTLPIMLQRWNGSSIDQMLSATDTMLSPGVRDSMRLGPATPNGYDDISPITRGEWGFLMVDKALEGSGRTVAVEMW